MLSLFRRGMREGGWLAMSFGPAALAFAHAESRSGKWRITRCGVRAAGESAGDLERAARQLELQRYRCLSVIPHTDYQVMLLDAPSVSAAELKAAVRWRAKDMLDFRVEDATIEVLDVPPEGPGRPHLVYAIAARNDTVRAWVERFEAARIPVSVIDIAETAQRNVAALYENPQRALAFLYLGEAHALLTINYRAELYLARRIEISMVQLLDDPGEETKGRILLEVQRSLDHFERQHPSVGVSRLLLGPEPRETGLAAYLAGNIDLPVAMAQLTDVLEFCDGCAHDPESLWQLFAVLGAALRSNGDNGRAAS